MNTEILGVALQIVLMVVLAYPLGKYIARDVVGLYGSRGEINL